MGEFMEIRDEKKKKESIHVGALLLARNIKQKDIARKYFIPAPDLNKVIKGHHKTPYIRKAIATELGMSIEEIWEEVNLLGSR